jgi:hypothetical protein
MQICFRSALGCFGLLAAFHAPVAFSKEVTRADFIEITYQTLKKYEAEFKSSGYIKNSCDKGRILNSKGVSLLGYRATQKRYEMYLSTARTDFKDEKDAGEDYFRYLADIQTAAFSRAVMSECPKVW